MSNYIAFLVVEFYDSYSPKGKISISELKRGAAPDSRSGDSRSGAENKGGL